MTHHDHQWTVTSYLLLGLPTTEGFSERVTSWHCETCNAVCDITGDVRHGFPLESPDFWDRVVIRQQARGLPARRLA
jgi:hypothetical protein